MPYRKIEEAGDDNTEGHLIKGKPKADDNTEGHGFRGHGGLESAGDDDAEGHLIKVRPNEDDIARAGGIDDADTEGHARRWPKDDDEPSMRAGRVEGDGTDTEGHGRKVRILEEAGGDDNTEGHVMRGRG